MKDSQRKAMFAKQGWGKGYDGLGRKLPVKFANIGDVAKVSFGSGIGSEELVKVIGVKPRDEFPTDRKGWLQVKYLVGSRKGQLDSFPRSRLEVRTK